MSPWSTLLLLFSLIIVPTDGTIREKKLFLFSVIQFPHDPCVIRSDNSMNGICMSASHCSEKGGVQDGNCASGFGVCCMFSVSECGSTIYRNCTYISNPGYPSTYGVTAQTTCEYVISGDESICQIRLDFDTFDIADPATTGACNTDYFDAVGGTGSNPPRICGSSTGQHMYIETGQSQTDSTLTFSVNGATDTPRSWKMKVSLIECINPSRAPQDCVQYFTGANNRNIKNYNFGQVIQNQFMSTCVRREEGYCGIDWSKSLISTPDPFELDYTNDINTTPADTALIDGNCDRAYVMIPGTVYDEGTGRGSDRFCGEHFNTLQGATTSSVVRSNHPNFILGLTTTNDDQLSMNGYNLVYSQVPCSSGGGGE